jgi:hypothetical protein
MLILLSVMLRRANAWPRELLSAGASVLPREPANVLEISDLAETQAQINFPKLLLYVTLPVFLRHLV